MSVGDPLWQAVAAAGVIGASVVAGLVVRHVVVRRLEGWAQRTSWRVDDALVASIRGPMLLWFALLGAFAGSKLVTIPRDVTPFVDKALVAALILSVTLWLADLAVRLLVVAAMARGDGAARTTGLVQNILRIGVFSVGGLVLLGTLGISVTPILTSLGIGGLAVALGLQETLSNLFAGVHITVARNIRVGDFIRLETGEEGVVEDIGWRAARIRMLPNNVVVIPNSRIAQSIVVNYNLPSEDLAVLVDVGVHYASDLAHVERVTCEEAREVMRTVVGAVPEFDPFIRYHSFGDSSVDFTAILRARRFTDTFLVKHEFIKRLARRYAKERIVIPFPIRAINLDQEGADAMPGIGRPSRPVEVVHPPT